MLTDEQCHALVGAQLWAGMDAGAFGPECVYEALRAAYDRGLEDAAKVCEDDKDLYPGGSPVDRLERMASKQYLKNHSRHI